MNYHALLEISSAGMGFEKKRLEVAALNLANMHSTSAPGTAGFRPMKVVLTSGTADFARHFRLQDATSPAVAGAPAIAVVPTDSMPRQVRDPGHPHADEKGNVSYPAVDHAAEMLTAMTALRAYEANVAAAGMARSMATRALEIGSQR